MGFQVEFISYRRIKQKINNEAKVLENSQYSDRKKASWQSYCAVHWISHICKYWSMKCARIYNYFLFNKIKIEFLFLIYVHPLTLSYFFCTSYLYSTMRFCIYFRSAIKINRILKIIWKRKKYNQIIDLSSNPLF